MKNIYLKRRFLQGIFVLMLMGLLPLTTAAQVDVHVTVLPPYSNKISDYLSRPQQCLIMIHNGTAVNQSVQLRGEFTGDNGVSIRTSATYKSAAPIRLAPNETRNLNISDIQNLFDINRITFIGITKQQFIQDNGVPEGNYQVCLQAFDYFTNQPLSGASPSGCSNIFPVISVEDPSIIAPYDGQIVSAAAGQNFVISWSTPAGAPPSTQYTVKIVQMFGNKSPQDAFNTSITPIFFQQTVIGTNSLLYGPAMPAMTLGRQYAIAITAADPSNTVTFKNKGQSVVTSFIYGDTTRRSIPIVSNTAAVSPATTTQIPVSTLSATVNWYYLKSEENAPAGQVPFIYNYPLPQLPGTVAHKVPGAHVYVNIQPIYTNTGSTKSTPIKTPPVGTVPGRGNAQAVRLTPADTVYSGSVFNTTTDADGNFQIPVAGIAEGISQNTAAAYQALGMAPPDSVAVSVEVQRTWGNGTQDFGPYYFPVSALKNGGPLNLGLLKANAYTFRFRPVVTDNSGKELTDALINVYRRSDFYTANPGLTDEGNFESNQPNREQDNIDGVMYTKVATLHSGEVATRLFFNSLTDSYKIQVTEGNHVPLNTTLTTSTYTTGITVPGKYTLQNGPTTFAGTVTRSVNGIQSPAQGAVVSFVNNLHQFFGVTDSLGHFSITNGITLDFNTTHDLTAPITPSNTPINFVVSYGGQAISDQVTIDKPNQTYTRDEVFKADQIPVSGTIVDEHNLPIPNPLIRWKSGVANVTTDANGNFSTFGVEGTDSLIISKLGYADKHAVITITQGLVYLKQAQQQTPMVGRQPFTTTNTFTPVGINSPLQNALNGNVGSISMSHLTGMADIYVTDEYGKPIPNAIITVEGYPDQQALVCDNNGYLHLIGPAGNVTFDVSGPANSAYVPGQFSYNITANGVTARLNLSLQAGIKISGVVNAGGVPVGGASVGVQFQDFGTATTTSDGKYTIVVPKGTLTLEASKQGYLADLKPANYTAATTVNFNLTTSDLNLTKLLGFNVQVDEIKDNGNNKLISGEFINLPANPVFSVAQGTKLRFADVPVTVQPDKTVIPVDNTIYTLEPSIKLRAFNYLPVMLSNADNDQYNDAIYIQKRSGNHGQIMGQLGVDFSDFMPVGIPPYTGDGLPITNNTQHALQCAAITDDGTLSGSTVLNIAGQTNNSLNFNVYGFSVNVDPASSYIQSDGLHIAGSVSLGSIPALSGTTISIKDFWIGTDGRIKNVSAQPNLSMNIVGWAATVQSLSFNDNGFTLGGNLQVQLPNTQGVSNVVFSGLQISKNSLYGGSFSLPQSGINVFGIANITGSQLSFGQVGNSSAYYLSGAGAINFTGVGASYIDPVKLSHFQLQTNGQFDVTATTNLQNNFFGGLAKYNVTQLNISNINNQPKIDIQGNFGLSIPDLASLNAGGIHFGSGGSVSVDNLGLSVDIAGIASANVNVGFGNNGFSGSGSFNVKDFANINCDFYYKKVSGGFQTGTKFSSSVYIPLGTSGLSITGLGGGFYTNTANNGWGVDINGTVAVGEDCFASAWVDFGIQNGPVITGTAKLTIGALTKAATGSLTINVPQKKFAVTFDAGINLAGLSEDAGGSLILSLDPADKYFVLGTYAKVDAFGIIKFNGSACLAYNLNVPRHSGDLANYVSAIPASFKSSQSFTGASALANFNYSLDDVLPNFDFNLGVVDFGAHSYFDMSANGYVLAGVVNNSSPVFSTSFGVNWACGGDAYFGIPLIGKEYVGLGVGFNAGFSGTAQFNPYHLSMQATAGAYFHAFWGDIDPGYCISGTNVPLYLPQHWWASVCLNPQLTVSYDNGSGFKWHF